MEKNGIAQWLSWVFETQDNINAKKIIDELKNYDCELFCFPSIKRKYSLEFWLNNTFLIGYLKKDGNLLVQTKQKLLCNKR